MRFEFRDKTPLREEVFDEVEKTRDERRWEMEMGTFLIC
jgi:hypothetical protein